MTCASLFIPLVYTRTHSAVEIGTLRCHRLPLEGVSERRAVLNRYYKALYRNKALVVDVQKFSKVVDLIKRQAL